MWRPYQVLHWCAGSLALLALASGLCGCRAILGPAEEQPSVDTKPWNQPAPWESRMMGVPY